MPNSMPPQPIPAKTGSSQYAAIRQALLARYNRHHGHPAAYYPESALQWQGVVDWLIAAVRPTVSSATWRKYRRAFVVTIPEDSLRQRLQSAKPAKNRDSKKKTGASLRQKSLDPRDLARLRHWMREHCPKWGLLAGVALEATRLTGLRPIEWQDAHLRQLDGLWVLRVRNRKAGSGNPELRKTPLPGYREIPLPHLGDHDIQVIRAQLHAVRRMLELGHWEDYQRGCRNSLDRANRELFPRRKLRISQYSGRHAFAANLKAAELSDEQGSQLMGHTNPHTFKKRYGGRRRPRAPRTSPANKSRLDRILARLNDQNDDAA